MSTTNNNTNTTSPIAAIGFAMNPNDNTTIVVLSNGNTWDSHYGMSSHTVTDGSIQLWSDTDCKNINCAVTEITPIYVDSALACAQVAVGIERTL